VVDSIEALFRAADILAMHKVRIDYGPGRHGIMRGTTIYFFDPSGNRLQTFGGYSAYQMAPDSRPVTWTQDQMTQAVFYYAQEFNETFLSVYTSSDVEERPLAAASRTRGQRSVVWR
jgi:catechol 2,3-dioxygenase